MDFGHLVVPVAGDGLEGKAKLAVVAGFEWGGGDGLGIDIGLVGADDGEGLGFDLGWELDVVAEEDLDGDAGDGLVASVADVAVDVGVLAAGDVFGLAHGELRERQIGGVGGQRLDGVTWDGCLLMRGEEQDGDSEKHDKTCDNPGDDGIAAAFGGLRREEFRGAGWLLLRLSPLWLVHKRRFYTSRASNLLRANLLDRKLSEYLYESSSHFHRPKNLLGHDDVNERMNRV
jgi:hypothetical protein